MEIPAVAISPAGTHIAYVASSGGREQLHVRAIDSLEAKALAGTELATQSILFSGRAVDRVLRAGKAEEGLGRGRHHANVVRRSVREGRELGAGRHHLLRGDEHFGPVEGIGRRRVACRGDHTRPRQGRSEPSLAAGAPRRQGTDVHHVDGPRARRAARAGAKAGHGRAHRGGPGRRNGPLRSERPRGLRARGRAVRGTVRSRSSTGFWTSRPSGRCRSGRWRGCSLRGVGPWRARLSAGQPAAIPAPAGVGDSRRPCRAVGGAATRVLRKRRPFAGRSFRGCRCRSRHDRTLDLRLFPRHADAAPTGTGSSQAPRWTPDGKHIVYRGTRAGFRNLWWKTVDDTDERRASDDWREA